MTSEFEVGTQIRAWTMHDEGMDAGVSAQTGHVRSTGLTYAVLANTSSGAWPVVRAILA